MIQDIAPHIYHNEYRPVPPRDTDVVFCFDGGEMLVKPDQSFFRYADVRDIRCTYLFRIDDTCFYLADLSDTEHVRILVRTMRSYEPAWLGYAGITAWQLYEWMSENTYCGKCGNETIPDSTERAMRCPVCGHIVYPRINPAVIVGVCNRKNQILVSRYAGRTSGNYALIAGFAETGETIEETVKREVKEETGVDVTDLKYYKSQPWSFSSTLLFGFWCRTAGDDTITVDENELSEAKWASPEELPHEPDGVSLTSEMISMFANGKAF